jgi:hypothetical protein
VPRTDYLAKKGTAAPAEKLREQLREAFAAVERAFDDVPVGRGKTRWRRVALATG